MNTPLKCAQDPNKCYDTECPHYPPDHCIWVCDDCMWNEKCIDNATTCEAYVQEQPKPNKQQIFKPKHNKTTKLSLPFYDKSRKTIYGSLR